MASERGSFQETTDPSGTISGGIRTLSGFNRIPLTLVLDSTKDPHGTLGNLMGVLSCPEGPSAQIIGFQVPQTVKSISFET